MREQAYTGHSGPYIVTVKRPCPYDCAAEHGADFDCDECNARPDTPLPVDRRAVATLEEAQQVARDIVVSIPNWPRVALEWVEDLDHYRTSVGPLPDGTVIEIEPATLIELAQQVQGGVRVDPLGDGPGKTVAKVISAFNAAQAEGLMT